MYSGAEQENSRDPGTWLYQKTSGGDATKKKPRWNKQMMDDYKNNEDFEDDEEEEEEEEKEDDDEDYDGDFDY